MTKLSPGCLPREFIPGIHCRTLASILVINKNTDVIMPAHGYSRRWTPMCGCHGKHYGGTSLIGRGGLFGHGKNQQQPDFPKREIKRPKQLSAKFLCAGKERVRG